MRNKYHKFMNSSKTLYLFNHNNEIKAENNLKNNTNHIENNIDNKEDNFDYKSMTSYSFSNRNGIRSKYKLLNSISKSQNNREINEVNYNASNINRENEKKNENENLIKIKVNRKENLSLLDAYKNKRKINNLKLSGKKDKNIFYSKYKELKESKKYNSIDAEESTHKRSNSKFLFYKKLKNKRNVPYKNNDNEENKEFFSKIPLIINKNTSTIQIDSNKNEKKNENRNISSLIHIIDHSKKIKNRFNSLFNSFANLKDIKRNNEDEKKVEKKENVENNNKDHISVNIIDKYKSKIISKNQKHRNNNKICIDNLSIFKKKHKIFKIITPTFEKNKNNTFRETAKKEIISNEIDNNKHYVELMKRLDDNIDDIDKNNSFKKFDITGKELINNKDLYNQIYKILNDIIQKSNLPSFNIEDYIIIKQIGDGTYGRIYEVIHKETNEKYAMKKILAHTPEKLELFIKEFEIIHSNPHKNILGIFGIYIKCIEHKKYLLYILMDLAENDWDKEIIERAKNNNYYTENELITILKQITSALVYLQKDKQVAHRDIKPENILIFNKSKKNYKLCDFGEAKVEPDLDDCNSLRGTELYMSPVLYSNLKSGNKKVKHNIYKSDVFSFGYCFLYAASLNYDIIRAVRDLKFQGLVNKLLDKFMKKNYSDEFIDIISKMINVDENERIDFVDLEILINDKLIK